MTSFHWLWLAVSVFSLGMLVVVMLLAPGWSRPDLFFSITVDPALRGSANARKIVRQFRRDVVLFSIPSWCLVLIGALGISNAVFASILFGPVIFLALIGITVAYVKAHRLASPYGIAPCMEREAVVAPRRVGLPGGWVGQLGPFVILGAACLYLWLHWNAVPNRFPIHWGMDGQVNGWARKTVGSALAIPVSGAGVCGVLAAILCGISRSGRRVFKSGAKGEAEARSLRSILWISLGLEYGVALIFGYLTLLPLPSHLPLWVLLVSEAVMEGGFIVALLVVVMKKGQGGWRATAGQKPELPPIGDRTPDHCWKGGLIYYNPDDPALWVEKRFGVGWTVNMANPRSWFLLGALLLLTLIPVVLIRWR